MKKPIKILSIDWDYFIDASLYERMTIFPDAHDDLPPLIQNICWAGRYAEQMPHLRNLSEVGVCEERFQQLKNYLKMLTNSAKYPYIKILLTDSHKLIYDFVVDDVNHGYPIKMVHIDHHSDAYGLRGTKVPDCGNWVDHLDRRLKEHGGLSKFSFIHWIANDDSDISSPNLSILMPQLVKKSETLDEVINRIFGNSMPDKVFICKSGPWSPPHLDDKFEEMAMCLKASENLMCTSDLKNRWKDPAIKSEMKNLKKYREEVAQNLHR